MRRPRCARWSASRWERRRRRNNLANDVSRQLEQHFGERVYRTLIPRNIRLAEAPSHGLPTMHYDKTSSGALAYLALAGELVRRDRAPGAATA